VSWHVEPDLGAYAERVLPWLERDPVRHTVPATIVLTRLDGTADPTGVWTAWLEDADGVAAIALRTPPRGVLMSALPPGAAAELAGIAPDGIPGAHGPAGTAAEFCAAYAARTGARPVHERTSHLYRLDTLVAPPPVPGRLRPMVPAEAPLLQRWLAGFAAEADSGGPPDDLARCERTIRQGRRMVWEAGGEPVCLVGLTPPVAGIPRIAPVWTPPERRRHGYATAATAATCALLLGRGAPAVVLFADDANTTAVGVYTRLGFRPVTEQQDWVLEY
jgi:RimJ/RimL family protein N-acetyltransferase